MKRQSGYYWVMLNKEWTIARYEELYCVFYIIGDESIFYENDFEIIMVSKITPSSP